MCARLPVTVVWLTVCSVTLCGHMTMCSVKVCGHVHNCQMLVIWSRWHFPHLAAHWLTGTARPPGISNWINPTQDAQHFRTLLHILTIKSTLLHILTIKSTLLHTLTIESTLLHILTLSNWQLKAHFCTQKVLNRQRQPKHRISD